MGNNETEILNQIIEKTDSILVIFFILLLIACILVFIPFYKLAPQNRADKNETEVMKLEKYIQRESQLLEVITKNTEVISELKILFETTIHSFTTSNEKINERVTAVDDKVDMVATKVTVLDTKVEQLLPKEK